MTVPAVPFAHLRRLTDGGGLYEHASGTIARPEHGYCVDDVARALVVVCREPGAEDLARHYLAFLLAAQAPDGRFRNRRGTDLRWRGSPSVQDCWGRALWGLGAAAAHADPALAGPALEAFDRAAVLRSPWPRASAFAALGAADVLAGSPGHAGAHALLADAAARLRRTVEAPAPGPGPGPAGWLWPEPRLSYANAVLPEALLAAGHALGDADLVAEGLILLGWLLDIQTRDGHLSVVPVGGWGPADLRDGRPGPAGFDQQPIEVAALADACGRAFALTGSTRWAQGVASAAGWFLGANDAGCTLMDVMSGGGCDGLERDGRNENQGAESTLALMSTLQQAHRLELCNR